jgi:anthranilate synthase component 2
VKVLLIDFYDSFTYNLVHYLEVLEVDLCTKRYDQIEPSDFFNLAAIVLSPGPGLPSEKQGLSEILTRNVGKLPIFGVCLGMQALVEHMGGSLENQKKVKHGVQETILLRSHQGLFSKLPQQIEVGLYHSWRVVCPNAWITASSQSGVPMAIERPEMMVYGVQFHPESIMTPEGKAILRNFMEIVRHN